MTDFDKKLETGKVGESKIAGWLGRRGHHIMPVYEVADGQYKGPSVYSSSGESIIAPDMLIFGKEKTTWIEAKHKSAFSWHRNSERIHEKPWVTGIDLHHYRQYQVIMEISDWPVWLLFLHQMGSAKDTPNGEVSPTGLYGNDLKYLVEHENHQSRKHGRTGMVYWHIDQLIRLATLQEVTGHEAGHPEMPPNFPKRFRDL